MSETPQEWQVWLHCTCTGTALLLSFSKCKKKGQSFMDFRRDVRETRDGSETGYLQKQQ
ncbi:hypothetical protein MTR_2g041440 [Medicago truncatula]|uniref:Uncharacterized protein n=1 Tax=Medicago truncatula TaxID=3880 RepID=A0A072V6U9_MEDTR|nr:hypothetical protein MTR_2g041440 [Medicago truncatula]